MKMERLMAIEVFDFRWPVSEGGHDWIQANVFGDERGINRSAPFPVGKSSGKPVWALTDNLAFGGEYRIKLYAPLASHTSLYKNFAYVDSSDRDNILRFANAYGMLGKGQPTDMTVEYEGKSALRRPVETWQIWKQEVLAMRRAVAIQDMLDSGDVDGISKLIYWKDGACFYGSRRRAGADHPEPGETWKLIEPVEDLFRADDVIMPARFLVQRWINERLAGNAGPQLRYDVRTARQVMQIIPNTLLSAMWLQFAQAVAGGRKHRLCKVCNTWFEIAPKGVDRSTSKDGPGRMNRQFCSEPCKTKDYRDRKAGALRLKAQGETVVTIAKKLHTPLQTIKKWVAKRKG
jgi:hypothetical protein